MENYWIIIIPASIGAIVSIAGILLNNFLNLINIKKIENYINYQKERINSYNEFHKQIISALGYLSSTYKYGSQPDFNEFNKKDIKTYLEKKGLLSGKIEEYTQNWENEKTENIYKISSFIHQTEPYMVENEINKARNIYISNIFYFSKEISGIVVELTRTMQRYNEGKRLVRKGIPKNDSEMEAEIKRLRDLWTTLDSLKEKYLNTIQTEIRNSIGEK